MFEGMNEGGLCRLAASLGGCSLTLDSVAVSPVKRFSGGAGEGSEAAAPPPPQQGLCSLLPLFQSGLRILSFCEQETSFRA